jgi:hypothetical protein
MPRVLVLWQEENHIEFQTTGSLQTGWLHNAENRTAPLDVEVQVETKTGRLSVLEIGQHHAAGRSAVAQ